MATAFARTILLYVILMVGIRAMGKRQIGELEPIELVLMLLISDLAAVPMQDFGIPLLNGVVPIITLLIGTTPFKSGMPKSCIGTAARSEMSNRFTLDELIDELRAQGVTDLTTVKYAVLETNGQLSVLLYPADAPATPRQLGKAVKDDVSIPVVLINDGHVMKNGLKDKGLDRAWLERTARAHGFHDVQEILLLTVDDTGKVLCVGKEGK